MKTITATKAFSSIRKHAEKIKNDEHQMAGEMSVGDTWSQGDIGIVCLGSLPKGCVKIERPVAQLAPGTTQGSRHCLESLVGITLYAMPDATVLDGPIIDAPSDFRVNHPEHGDVSFRPGVYGVIYQRSLAEELRRVQD